MNSRNAASAAKARKIRKLSAEQEAELPRFRQRYLSMAASTGRINRASLEAALADAYAVIGKPAPKLVIFDSPLACLMALKAFALPRKSSLANGLRSQLAGQFANGLRSQLGDDLWSQLGGDLVDDLRSQFVGDLGSQLAGHIGSQLVDELGSQIVDDLAGQLANGLRSQIVDDLTSQLGGDLVDDLGSQLVDHLRSQLAGQLANGLRSQLGDDLVGQLVDELGSQIVDGLWSQLVGQLVGDLRSRLVDELGSQDHLWNGNFLWGSQDLYWIAASRFAQYAGAKLEAETDRRLGIMERIAEQCEWWWPHENIVVASEKPVSVRWDEQRRLHAEDRAAVEYSDGYALYAWHGTRLPAEWVLNRETIDPTEILRCENVEQRAAGAACVGWPRMLSALDYRIVDSDPEPSHGELIEVSLTGLPRPGRFLKAECPRNGTIVEGVPFETRTVLEAQAWRVGLAASEFSYPTIRT